MTASSHVTVAAGIKKAELRAVIIRADGTEEDYGVIASYERPEKKSFLKRVLGLFS